MHLSTLPAIMTRLIATTIFILVVSALTAQTKDKTIFVGNVISDTTTFRSNDYRTALTSILKSENKIEIRFITSPSFENRKEYKNYTVTDITEIYREKENMESSKQFVKENNKTNLAQVFTEVRYKGSDSDFFSAKLLKMLKSQGFVFE